MLTTKIPGLHPDLAETLKAKGWKAEIILEHSKTKEMDGREYLANLKEFIAQADDVPVRWVDRSMFWNTTVLWICDENNRDKVLGCLLFNLKQSRDRKVPRLGVNISHISVMGSDAVWVDMGCTMIRCLKCLLRGGDQAIPVQLKEDRVLGGLLKEEANLPLVFITEVEWNKKPDARETEVMKAIGFKETRHLWTMSMSAVMFEHEF